MTSPAKPKTGFFQWFLIFLVIFFLVRTFFPSAEPTETTDTDTNLQTTAVEFTPTHETFTVDDEVVLTLTNPTFTNYSFESDCPSEPFIVERLTKGTWQTLTATNEKVVCADVPPFNLTHWFDTSALTAGSTRTISYSDWNRELFGEPGTYRITLTLTEMLTDEEIAARLAEAEAAVPTTYEPIATASEDIVIEPTPTDPEILAAASTPQTISLEANFEITGRSWFGAAWQYSIYQPIFNVLVYLTAVLPGHSLGWGIIALTLIIRLLLLAPNQKALRSQRAMQAIQPKLEEVKLKYASDPQKMSEETMKLWRDHGVNPFGSCLPLLIQFPILIALFYVIRAVNDGFSTSEIAYLYQGVNTFDVDQIGTSFYGLDLAATGVIWLAVALAAVQFFQLRLSLAKQAKKSQTKSTDPAAQMTSTMQYVMPALIGFMAFNFPAAVSIYWGTSTLFGICQQVVVNREKIS